jgi:hypothetical protein
VVLPGLGTLPQLPWHRLPGLRDLQIVLGDLHMAGATALASKTLMRLCLGVHVKYPDFLPGPELLGVLHEAPHLDLQLTFSFSRVRVSQ